MTTFLAAALPNLVGPLSQDDNAVAALAVMAGVVGGWYLANLTQLRARKAKLMRKNLYRPPKD
ncbi:MAG TPA: hypothetical protein VME21_09295 [Steroidobacteraceae bacterium]|nr:hypothetical protein [Steroidobacteraceae bacterium]